MGYSIEIISKAEREFLKLPGTIQKELRRQILSLENNPRPFGSSKLKDSEFHRIRSGDYRVIYSIDDKKKAVKVLSIAHRREVYR
jgi:mRNA interferase RelE/StbE